MQDHQGSLEKSKNSYLFGSNISYIEEKYEQYLEDKNSISTDFKTYFDSIQNSNTNDVNHTKIVNKFIHIINNNSDINNSNAALDLTQIMVWKFINDYRSSGFMLAKLDPLNLVNNNQYNQLDPTKYFDVSLYENEYIIDINNINNKMKLKDIITKFTSIYSDKIGYEFMYLNNTEEKLWLISYIENNYTNFDLTREDKLTLFKKLIESECIEKVINTKFSGQKRFSLEGGESLIPALHQIIVNGSNMGLTNLYVGMSHRGRINALVNLTGKSPQKIFDEFNGNYHLPNFASTGDVKYHKGYKCNYIYDNNIVKITILFNPSHLEIVNPILNGVVRAEQDSVADKSQVLGVLIHGDSAFIGLGTNQGVFNMSQTTAYNVNGIIHLVVNNQIGFTTSEVNESRSSMFCTGIAKMIECPIIHVNGDDIIKLAFVMKLAVEYRFKFNKDIVIDIVGFRKYGHNESDDPTLTQPIMYKKIREHIGIRSIYMNELINSKVIDEHSANKLYDDYKDLFNQGVHPNSTMMIPLTWYSDDMLNKNNEIIDLNNIVTSINEVNIKHIGNILTTLPRENFKVHPTISKLLTTRKSMVNNEIPFDFGMAEMLAYGSLLNQGISIRFSGEDSKRGTFTHRNATWHNTDDTNIEQSEFNPLTKLENNSKISLFNSVLNEECVLGFEYGYSITKLSSLVIWEAQFGDFANGAQVIIDQFISSGESKWGILSNLVMFLPHGFDGQGPEHSSARIERFLQLSANNNLILVYPSTAAQMFHILRYQALANVYKPLVLFVSKKLLRYKAATSNITEITQGSFKVLIADDMVNLDLISTVVVCSGQIYYNLLEKRQQLNLNSFAFIRIEMLYPFPTNQLTNELKKYKNANKFIWCQEEHVNQGAWMLIKDKLNQCSKINTKFIDVCRPESSSPACGMTSMHENELCDILNNVFDIKK